MRSDKETPNKTTKAVEIQAILLEDILSGKLPHASKLNEIELAKRFGVSRTPIREALKYLNSSGLVSFIPHKGVHVSGIDPEKIWEMFEAMAEMEAICAKLSALKMNPFQRIKLEQFHLSTQDHSDALDYEIHHHSNIEFHNLILSGSQNTYLYEIAKNLRNRISPFRRLQFKNTGRIQQSLQEHNSIVQAILKRDADSAYQAMYHHLISSGKSFATYLEQI